jgi:hypothetical protein
MSSSFLQGAMLGTSVSMALVSVSHYIWQRRHKEREDQLYIEAKHLATKFRQHQISQSNLKSQTDNSEIF